MDTGRYLVIVRTGFERINWNFTGGFQTEPRGDAWNWSLRQPIEVFSLFPCNSVRRSPFVVHRLLRPPMVLFHTHTRALLGIIILLAREIAEIPCQTRLIFHDDLYRRGSNNASGSFFSLAGKESLYTSQLANIFPELRSTRSKLSVLLFG